MTVDNLIHEPTNLSIVMDRNNEVWKRYGYCWMTTGINLGYDWQHIVTRYSPLVLIWSPDA